MNLLPFFFLNLDRKTINYLALKDEGLLSMCNLS